MRRRRVYIARAGVVSPYGAGIDSLGSGLLSGRCALRQVPFAGIGPLAVGACEYISRHSGEDRTITMLRDCLDQFREDLDPLLPLVSPERRAVCAATSKGAFLTMAEVPPEQWPPLPDLLPGAPANWLARAIGACGPRQSLVGACATGLMNVIRAGEWVAEGHADIALAAAAEASLTPVYLQSFLGLGAMNRVGCFPYDTREAGLVAGEGAAVLLLVSEEVVERGCIDPLGEWLGGLSLAEAYHPTAINTDGQQIIRMVRTLLKQTGISLAEIDVICTHGTGTVGNDRAEAAALLQLYPEKMPHIFATKGAIGHLMGATGIVELAACLTIRHNLLPTVGFHTPAPGAERLNLRRTAGTAEGINEVILKWSLGFGGHLAAGLLRAA